MKPEALGAVKTSLASGVIQPGLVQSSGGISLLELSLNKSEVVHCDWIVPPFEFERALEPAFGLIQVIDLNKMPSLMCQDVVVGWISYAVFCVIKNKQT